MATCLSGSIFVNCWRFQRLQRCNASHSGYYSTSLVL